MKQMHDLDKIKWDKSKIPTIEDRIKADREDNRPPPLSTYITTVIASKSGVIKERDVMKSHSFVKAFMFCLMVQALQGFSVATCKNTAGVEQTADARIFNFKVTAIVGSPTVGITLGTGTTPVDILDFNIETIIPEGVAAGQLNYQAAFVSEPITDATTSSFNISRVAQNNSGGSITIEEMALIGRLDGISSENRCFDRTLKQDVLGDTLSITKTYTPTITVL